jgi:hypothetical protein
MYHLCVGTRRQLRHPHRHHEQRLRHKTRNCYLKSSFLDIDEQSPVFTLHPNPTTGRLTIRGERLRQAAVANLLGQQVLSAQGMGDELCLDLAALPAGIYFITVTDEEGRNGVRKVVKE